MRVAVAVGGHALLDRGEVPLAQTQEKNVAVAVSALAPLARDHDLVITHGNGPQIGLLANESSADPNLPAPYSLDVLGAQTQGMIGYFLLQELADHPLGLGAEHIEGVGSGQIGIGGALVGQQADLRPVPVGDHQIMVPGQRSQGADRYGDVLLLGLGERDLPAFEQGVAAYRPAHPRLSCRWSRPWPPWWWGAGFPPGRTRSKQEIRRPRLLLRGPTGPICRASGGPPRSRCCAGRGGSAGTSPRGCRSPS